LRILFLSHYFPPEGNAPASRTFEHCARWARAGHDVTVVTCAPNCPAGVVYPGYKNRLRRQIERVDGVRVVRVWTYLAANAGTVRRIANYLSFLLSATLASIWLPKPDVVVATSPQFFCGWAGVLVSRLKRVPLVLEIRDIWPESIEAVGAMRNRRLLRLLEWMERVMYRAAAHVVAVGAGYRRKILEKVDLADRISVITNGVDLKAFAPGEPDGAFLRRWGLGDCFVCSYVGTIGMAHGLEVVLDAAKILRDSGRRDVRFCLIGDGAARQRLEEQTRQAGLDGRVVFTGRLPKDQVPTAIASSQACLIHLKDCALFGTVIPSKIFETMAMGRPIVMGVRGEALDIVHQAGAGLAVEPESPRALVDAVLRLADEPGLASRLGRSGRAFVAERYNRDRLAAEYLRLLGDVTGLVAEPASADPAADERFSRRPGPLRRASRWWYVLRYHRWSQLTMRVILRGRIKLLGLTGARRYTHPSAPIPAVRSGTGFEAIAQWKLAQRPPETSSSIAEGIARGGYRFLNRERNLPEPVDWRLEQCGDVADLWRFHLHYHEFLLDLAAEGLRRGESAWLDRAWRLVAAWIAGNRPGDRRVHRDGWHPFCISRRLPVWTLLWSASPPESDIAEAILRSLCVQARFLEEHLEWDVRGNHLIENAKALVFAGAFFEGAEARWWLEKAGRILRKELGNQILPHGEHFERSPMYHAQVLEAVLDVRDAAREVAPELSRRCGDTAVAMAGFLRALLAPDGAIPLLGDSCFGETPAPGALIARAEGGAPEQNPRDGAHDRPARVVGDYWIYRHAADSLLFDAGPVGPDHLPAHAHADLLGIEASVAGRRLLVDGGVFGYEDDAMRAYCRSSAAHNVLEIDGRDPCDVWSRFRMGRRGHPHGFETGETHGFFWARATHNGYRRLGVPEVGRWVACRPGGPWLLVDWARGRGTHQMTSRLRLHPDVGVHQTAENEVRLQVNDAVLRLRPLAGGAVRVAPGWYCPEFGLRRACPVIQGEAAATLPHVGGWCLAWEGNDGDAELKPADSGDTILLWNEQGRQFELARLRGSVFTGDVF